MNNLVDNGQAIELVGKSGHRYSGRIYLDKNSPSMLSGKAIACLSNSSFDNDEWSHQVNSIYNTENTTEELVHFRDRDDISHLVLLPYSMNEGGVIDKVDDLIRNYIHS